MRLHPVRWSVALAIVLAAAAPASAQINLVGYWSPLYDEDWLERIPGPDVGDYAGLPITAAARKRANTWEASLLTLPEHQCKPHPSTYGFRGIGQVRIWEDRDPQTQRLVKVHTFIQYQEQHREIWMDGRPHPSDLEPHTWQGFSTGRFEGDVLVVRTTHLKAGWVRRNGVPLSDRATMTERFFRHDDLLTQVVMMRTRPTCPSRWSRPMDSPSCRTALWNRIRVVRWSKCRAKRARSRTTRSTPCRRRASLR